MRVSSLFLHLILSPKGEQESLVKQLLIRTSDAYEPEFRSASSVDIRTPPMKPWTEVRRISERALWGALDAVKPGHIHVYPEKGGRCFSIAGHVLDRYETPPSVSCAHPILVPERRFELRTY